MGLGFCGGALGHASWEARLGVEGRLGEGFCGVGRVRVFWEEPERLSSLWLWLWLWWRWERQEKGLIFEILNV